jgi:hypothetical protein
MASVEVAVICPAATLVICRSKPGVPTLTTLAGVVPAKPPKVVPPTIALAVGTAAAVTEPCPSATSPALSAWALLPIAVPLATLACARVPIAVATLPLPVAVE